MANKLMRLLRHRSPRWAYPGLVLVLIMATLSGAWGVTQTRAAPHQATADCLVVALNLTGAAQPYVPVAATATAYQNNGGPCGSSGTIDTSITGNVLVWTSDPNGTCSLSASDPGSACPQSQPLSVNFTTGTGVASFWVTFRSATEAGTADAAWQVEADPGSTTPSLSSGSTTTQVGLVADPSWTQTSTYWQWTAGNGPANTVFVTPGQDPLCALASPTPVNCAAVSAGAAIVNPGDPSVVLTSYTVSNAGCPANPQPDQYAYAYALSNDGLFYTKASNQTALIPTACAIGPAHSADAGASITWSITCTPGIHVQILRSTPQWNVGGFYSPVATMPLRIPSTVPNSDSLGGLLCPSSGAMTFTDNGSAPFSSGAGYAYANEGNQTGPQVLFSPINNQAQQDFTYFDPSQPVYVQFQVIGWFTAFQFLFNGNITRPAPNNVDWFNEYHYYAHWTTLRFVTFPNDGTDIFACTFTHTCTPTSGQIMPEFEFGAANPGTSTTPASCPGNCDVEIANFQMGYGTGPAVPSANLNYKGIFLNQIYDRYGHPVTDHWLRTFKPCGVYTDGGIFDTSSKSCDPLYSADSQQEFGDLKQMTSYSAVPHLGGNMVRLNLGLDQLFDGFDLTNGYLSHPYPGQGDPNTPTHLDTGTNGQHSWNTQGIAAFQKFLQGINSLGNIQVELVLFFADSNPATNERHWFWNNGVLSVPGNPFCFNCFDPKMLNGQQYPTMQANYIQAAIDFLQYFANDCGGNVKQCPFKEHVRELDLLNEFPSMMSTYAQPDQVFSFLQQLYDSLEPIVQQYDPSLLLTASNATNYTGQNEHLAQEIYAHSAAGFTTAWNLHLFQVPGQASLVNYCTIPVPTILTELAPALGVAGAYDTDYMFYLDHASGAGAQSVTLDAFLSANNAMVVDNNGPPPYPAQLSSAADNPPGAGEDIAAFPQTPPPSGCQGTQISLSTATGPVGTTFSLSGGPFEANRGSGSYAALNILWDGVALPGWTVDTDANGNIISSTSCGTGTCTVPASATAGIHTISIEAPYPPNPNGQAPATATLFLVTNS
jgi:hypothetical protein